MLTCGTPTGGAKRRREERSGNCAAHSVYSSFRASELRASPPARTAPCRRRSCSPRCADGISASGIVMMSFERTVTSAYLPGVREPSSRSDERGVRVVQRVRPQRLGARQPLLRERTPSRPSRRAPPCRRSSGSGSRPPPACRCRSSRSRPNPRATGTGTTPLRARSLPSFEGIHGASEIVWIPCIDAITPSCAKRGTSGAAMCCACSMRQRRSVLPGIRAEGALVDVEHLAVRAIADGVRRELEVVAHRDVGDFLETRRLLERQPRAARQVDVRREEPRAVGAERAVDLALDRAHGEEAVRRGRSCDSGRAGCPSAPSARSAP